MNRAGSFAPIIVVALAALLIGAAPANADDRRLYTPEQLAAIYRHALQKDPPLNKTNRVAGNEAAAALGQFLFFDARFSADGKVSCASCHQPERAFTDGRALAKGLAVGTRNAPTLLNAAYNHWYFHDGRTDSLWSQALQPPESPREFGTDRLSVVHGVYNDADLRRAYEHVFGPLPSLNDAARFPKHARPIPAEPGAPLNRAWQAMSPSDRDAVNRAYSNLGKAIAAYERKLVSRDSPFDEYVAGLRTGDPGKRRILPPAAKRGLKLFVGAANCELCHSGPEFSDGQFHNIGLPQQPGAPVDIGWAGGIPLVKTDVFNGAGVYSDDPTGPAKDRIDFLPPADKQLGKFKTPTLRNVALTAPYMHDGRFATLHDVLQFYADEKTASPGKRVGTREATLDLIRHLTPQQISDLEAFLKTLTGAPLSSALMHAPPNP
jgi:cytochrome c peroxidase